MLILIIIKIFMGLIYMQIIYTEIIEDKNKQCEKIKYETVDVSYFIYQYLQ